MTLTPQRPNVNPIIISFSQPHNICISPLRYAAIRVKRGQIKKEMGGKKNKSRRKEKAKHGQGSSSLSSFPSPPLSASAGPDQPHFPLPLHANADFPPYKDGFLRDVGNCRKSYQHALDTAYEGFVCDGPDATTPSGEAIFNHERIRRALQKLDSENYFRTDVTQPFGLGTKCAKTYVTRCLLGARGTTYKYLGLRMFSHPWDGSFVGKGQDGRDNKNEISIKESLRCFSELNNILTKRTESHLSVLGEKRAERGGPPIRGRAGFDVTLINRMEYSPDLKAEPTTGKGRCAVSWHADSSLEHYSTIGVYHTIFGRHEKAHEHSSWSVALRVAHDSEGPQAGHRGTDIESSVVKESPIICASLSSGASYYMLDDFNHHHQHAVLAPENATSGTDSGVRFSSTHRLLRQGHNANFVIERCRTTVAGFHRRGRKVWRSEQLLLSDIEFEWIRQFYVQGLGHKKILWQYWRKPICDLLKYWGQLECRTKQVIDILKLAAEERCGIGSAKSARSDVPSRAERKMREKRKKAARAIEEILNRGDSSEDAYDHLYTPMANLLEERGNMRRLWQRRENEKIFSRMQREYHPLEPPLMFDVDLKPSKEKRSEGQEAGVSPLSGSAEDLQNLASKVLKWGKAYLSMKSSDLPESSKADGGGEVSEQFSHHMKSPSWPGWSHHSFGLEMQKPWAALLVSGEKKIETRAYELPVSLQGRRILILESQAGVCGVSSLGDIIDSEKNKIENYVKILGWAVFDRVIEYKDKTSFERDEKLHLVEADSGYGWKEGKTNVVYGWVVSDLGTSATAAANVGAIVRRMRSLYQIQPERAIGALRNDVVVNEGKKKKNKKKNWKRKGGAVAVAGALEGRKKKKRRY